MCILIFLHFHTKGTSDKKSFPKELTRDETTVCHVYGAGADGAGTPVCPGFRRSRPQRSGIVHPVGCSLCLHVAVHRHRPPCGAAFLASPFRQGGPLLGPRLPRALRHGLRTPTGCLSVCPCPLHGIRPVHHPAVRTVHNRGWRPPQRSARGHACGERRAARPRDHPRQLDGNHRRGHAAHPAPAPGQ